MTLLVCLDCSTAFAVGVPRCPHCGSERKAEEGTAAAMGLHARGRVEEDIMPKITVHGGPSDRHAAVELREAPGTGVPMEAVEVPADGSWSQPITGDGSGRALPPVENEGGEDVSAGTSTETSSEKQPTKPEPSAPAAPKPARTTGSRSRKARTGNRSASSTDGGPTDGTSETDSAADGSEA